MPMNWVRWFFVYDLPNLIPYGHLTEMLVASSHSQSVVVIVLRPVRGREKKGVCGGASNRSSANS